MTGWRMTRLTASSASRLLAKHTRRVATASRRGQQFQRGFGDEREGAAGADQQAGEVIAGDTLGRAATACGYSPLPVTARRPRT